MIILQSILVKAISSSLIVTIVLSNPIIDTPGSSSGWRHDKKGTWYQESDKYATGWKNINNNYYYFYEGYDSKGYDFKDYSYNNYGPAGYMAHDTIIDGLYLNHNGEFSKGGSEIKAYINLLDNRDWLNNNVYADYDRNITINNVYVIDIDQDGSCELLINGWKSLYVISYNNGDIKKIAEIHDADGGYYGYSPSLKMLFVEGGRMGAYYIDGYKIKNNECVQGFSSTDNQKYSIDDQGQESVTHTYTINNQHVSTAEYNAYFKKLNIIKNIVDE